MLENNPQWRHGPAGTDDALGDFPGARPEREVYAGARGFLHTWLGLLRRHGVRAFGLALLATLASLLVTQVVQWPLLALFLAWGIHSYVWRAAFILAILGVAPFLAGYWWTIVLLLQGRQAGARALLAPFRRGRLLLNTMLATSVYFIGPFVLRWLWHSLDWQYASPIVGEGSPLAQLIAWILGRQWLEANLLKWITTLLFVPFVWAGLEALVCGRTWWDSLRRSARLALRNWRFTALVFVVSITTPFIYRLTGPLAEQTGVLSGWAHTLMSGTFVLASTVLFGVKMLVEGTVLVVVYREILWREQEAAEPSPERL